jgi:hypothetical protein
MSFKQKLKHECKALGLAFLYFGCWVAVLAVLKQLILAEHQIEFRGWSLALVGTLVLSKVVVVLEHVPLGPWIQARPAWVEVLVRTILCAVGVLVALLLEKAFEGRHEHGGFGASLMAVFQNVEVHRVWANTIWVSCALLGYNVLSTVRRHLGEGGLVRLFLSPPLEASGVKPAESSARTQAIETGNL